MGRVIGRVVSVAPTRNIVARVEDGVPRIGARVEVAGALGRVVDVIGPVDGPYAVIKLDNPSLAPSIEAGSEVVLVERPPRRRRGRRAGGRRGKRGLPRRTSAKRGREARMQRNRRGGKRAGHNR